ncbi:MAG: translation initiation factor IF-2 [Candidatus Midichloriaceae bacterium]|jgi:translation initiation factor IF-2
MPENNDKDKKIKPLGISDKKLGLKLPSTNVGNKEAANKKFGTVIVVTKSKNNSKNENYVGEDDGSLTLKERQNRLSALLESEKSKNAAIENAIKKKKIEESKKNIKKKEVVKEVVKFPNIKNIVTESEGIKDLDYINKKSQKPIENVKTTVTTSTADTKKLEDKKKATKFNGTTAEEEDSKKKKEIIKKRDVKKITLSALQKIEEEHGVETKITTIRRKSRSRNKDKKHLKKDKIFREVEVKDEISIQELASKMAEKVNTVMKILMNNGVAATINDVIDIDTAELVIEELGHTAIRKTDADIEKTLFAEEIDDESSLKTRPPIVTIMGHVDHGKTSLLDALRETNVVSREAGGITQHIGAYNVKFKKGKSITFLDTPGHEAFTAMRMRGAEVTDIVIIVVAADDGIKTQTIEAINHAKAAKVQIIVAINKIDKSTANVEKVKNSLLSYELIPEAMGGDVIVIPVSAKERKGLDDLEEAILILAEIMDVKANPDRKASGVVIESKVDKNMGVLATFIIQRGTLRISDIVVVGDEYFKVRSLIDDKGTRCKEASLSMPVEILGMSFAPEAGEQFVVVENEKAAKKIIEFKKYKKDKNKIVEKKSIEELFNFEASDVKTLNVIIKADVHGSLEAIKSSLEKISDEKVKIKFSHMAVGGVLESDISLAKVSGSIVIGFNTKADSKTTKFANKLEVDIKYYSVIYDLLNEIKAIAKGLVAPVRKESIAGHAEIRQVFNLSSHGKVAGCMVTDGVISSRSQGRLLRDNVVIYDGKLATLKRFKEDVKEVRTGFECGISFEKFNDIKEKDIFEAYTFIEEKIV